MQIYKRLLLFVDMTISRLVGNFCASALVNRIEYLTWSLWVEPISGVRAHCRKPLWYAV